MTLNIKNIFTIGFLWIALSLNAQQELGLNFSRQVWQSSYTNPAFVVSGSKGHFAFPSFYAGAYSTLNRFRIANNSINTSSFFSNAADFSVLSTALHSDVLDFGFRKNKVYYSFKSSLKSDYYMGIPKDLLGVVAFGNGRYIGKEIQIGPDFDFSAYVQTSIGAAYEVNKKLTLGVKLNVYNGIFNVSTPLNTASIYTDADIYQLRLKTDYQLNASAFDLDGLGESVLNFIRSGNGTGNSLFPNVFKFNKNSGLGVDLGATYRINDKVQLSASAINLGSIKWKNEVTSVKSNGIYEFNGVNIDKVFRGDSLNLTGIEDTLLGSFRFKTTGLDSYRTTLPGNIYVGGTYQYSDKVQFGAVVNFMTYHGNFLPAAALSASLNLGQTWSLGATYAVRKNDFTNFGINTMLRLGVLQGYANFDNILGVFSPTQFGNSNVRAGVNLIFGKTPKAQKKEIVLPKV